MRVLRRNFVSKALRVLRRDVAVHAALSPDWQSYRCVSQAERPFMEITPFIGPRETKHRVLVVDDDERLRAAIGAILENAKFDHLAILPTQIEEMLSTYRPTSVLLDLSMPTIDGIGVLDILRTQRYGGLVIVMSGSNRDLIETARRVGQSYGLRMAQGLEKPFRSAQLVETLRSDDAVKASAGEQCDVNRAFANGEICFYYQPKFDLRSRRLIGFESLVRWQHPQRGLLQPIGFLNQIATAGLNGELARAALKDAVARLSEWRDAGVDTQISINVGLPEATDPGFLLQVTAAVTSNRIQPSALTLELLEAPADMDLSAAAAALTRVRLLGVGVSIDDFGTQSSSLARLQHLPANEMKIDRSFVLNLLRFKRDQVLVRFVIGMARELGMTAVAEGIEDQETMTLLLEMGCTYGQGYHLSRPLPVAEATRLLMQDGIDVKRAAASG